MRDRDRAAIESAQAAAKAAGITGQAANTDRNKAPGMGRRVPVAAAATGRMNVPNEFVVRHRPGSPVNSVFPAEYDVPDDDLETDGPPVDITGTDGD